MITKPVIFRMGYEEKGVYNGGILVVDGFSCYVICGCCGAAIKPDEISEITEFEDWLDISDKIVEGLTSRLRRNENENNRYCKTSR